MLLERRHPIGPHDTAGDLHDALAELGAAALIEALDGLAAGTLTARPQPARARLTRRRSTRPRRASTGVAAPSHSTGTSARSIPGRWPKRCLRESRCACCARAWSIAAAREAAARHRARHRRRRIARGLRRGRARGARTAARRQAAGFRARFRQCRAARRSEVRRMSARKTQARGRPAAPCAPRAGRGNAGARLRSRCMPSSHEGRSADDALEAAQARADRAAVRAIALGTLRWYLRLAPALAPLVNRPFEELAPRLAGAARDGRAPDRILARRPGGAGASRGGREPRHRRGPRQRRGQRGAAPVRRASARGC